MTLFRCEHLTKKIGDYRIENIDFSLKKGTILGLIGINGCGKTTLLRTILGSYKINTDPENSGELYLDGKHFIKDIKEYRSRIAYVLQDSPFSMNMQPLEIGERYGCYYEGFDLEKYKGLLDKYNVKKKNGLAQLSKGEAIRVQLAFALSYPAKLYVFDEPAGNLDVEFRDGFYETIRELVSNEESSVIISSHLVSELEHIADELLWMGRNENSGFTRFIGSIDDLMNSYRIISADKEEAVDIPKALIAGSRVRESHSEYLLYKKDGCFEHSIMGSLSDSLRYPSLQEIMYYVEKQEE